MYFSPPSKGYKEVCGKVIGYQYYSTNAFYHQSGHTNDSYYVDDVSLTYGSSPRKHIWTFAAGLLDNVPSKYNCPCSSGSPQTVPSFVGNDYFCESGCSDSSVSHRRNSTLVIHCGMEMDVDLLNKIVVKLLVYLGFIKFLHHQLLNLWRYVFVLIVVLQMLKIFQ